MSNTDKKKQRQSHITVVHNMPDYSKAPYFVKQLEKAKAFFAENGLPKGWEIKKEN